MLQKFMWYNIMRSTKSVCVCVCVCVCKQLDIMHELIRWMIGPYAMCCNIMLNAKFMLECVQVYNKMLKDPLMGLGFGTQWCVNIKLNYKLV